MVTKGMLCFCGAVHGTERGVAERSGEDCPTETAAPQMSPVFINFAARNVCHENKSAVCRVVVRNFRRNGGRPTTFGEQALIVNHFMLL